MAQMTILRGPERRRRWSDEQRERILAEAFHSGARVCDVARRHDVARSLIYQWRRAAVRQAEPRFVPAVVVDDAPRPVSEPVVAAVLDLPDGGRLRIFASASPALAAAALKALR
ncbi:transposase [Sphingomonas sp. SORGH_AS 879]|nr:transposase [Sphingomonas sp. SORGH_AS_0879]